MDEGPGRRKRLELYTNRCGDRPSLACMLPSIANCIHHMFNALMIASGIAWTLTYLLIIRQGYREQTYGMPVAALAANLSWEFIFAIVHPHGVPQVVVNWVWLTFDLAIGWQVLRHGPREWGWPRSHFIALFAAALATAFPAVLLVTYEFAEFDRMSGAYAAFGQNLMMSILFVNMYRERGARGQTPWIAAGKLLGTLCASAAFYSFTSLGASPLMLFLYGSILLFDSVYLGLVAGVLPMPTRQAELCPRCSSPTQPESRDVTVSAIE